MQKYDLLSFNDDQELTQAVAQRWLQRLDVAGGRGPFLVALSGGRIARGFFSSVAELGKSKSKIFDPVHFFWADERCVPPTDPESNYRVSHELLFIPLGIGLNRIHRIRGEEVPEIAAKEAERELLRVALIGSNGLPVFDITFLGMGEDGHVASLFPEEMGTISDNEPVYRAVRASKPPPERITLGYNVVTAAKEVWVLASGPGKEEALRKSLAIGASTPLGRVIDQRAETSIFTDIRI
jgi:6-phosphogluconolactonase